MKRDSVSAYVHTRRDIPLYAPVHILDDTPPSPPPPVEYERNEWPQPKNK